MEAEAVKEENQKEGAQNASGQVAAAVAPSKQLSTKRPRREERNRKDDRSYDVFMKTVNAAPAAEQLSVATQKYLEMVDENKKMQFYIKQSDKRHALILKEKEQLQLEFNKTVLLKSKLENLCRELQKQNKSIKDESLHKIREEEERRKETQAKFQSTLAEISTLLQQNNEKNAKLRDDNISMTEKFKSVVQQYQMREDQVEKMSKQMELESQLNAAKMQKASLEHQAERERLAVEMETLRMAVVEYRAKINEMQGTETGLRGQLAVYTDKYDEFQSALMKSNQVFGGFKDQMEKMSKKIKTLEKESLSWKQRWESSQSALLDMCGERQAGDARLQAVQRQLAHMQSLCRTLQAERTVLLGTLKEHDIERPPLPAPAPAPAPEPLPPPPAHSAASDAKVDAMAVNCAQLRQSLAHLQSQLNVLSTQQTQPEEPAQAEKPKKNKNKKKSKKAAIEETKGTTEETTNDVTTNEDVATEKVAETDDNSKETLSTEESASKEIVDKQSVDTESVDMKSIDKEESTEVTKTTDVESVDLAVETIDEKVLESLMQAITVANVNICELEVVGDNGMTIEEVLDGDAKITEITDDSEATDTKLAIPESNDVENSVGDKNEIASPEKMNQKVPDSPKKASPKSSPKKNTPKASPKKVKTESKHENKEMVQVPVIVSNSEASNDVESNPTDENTKQIEIVKV